MNDPDREIIEEIEKQIAEGTDLDDLTPVNMSAPRNPRGVFSVRFSAEELAVLTEAARARDLTLGDFIRQASIATALRGTEEPDVMAARDNVRRKVRELSEAVRQL